MPPVDPGLPRPEMLVPTLGDFNDDLRASATEALAAGIREQLAPEDAARCWAQSR